MVMLKQKAILFLTLTCFPAKIKQCLALNVAKTFNRRALTSYRKSRQVALMKKVRRPSPHFSKLHWFEIVSESLQIQTIF